jgi:hypothetical protein
MQSGNALAGRAVGAVPGTALKKGQAKSVKQRNGNPGMNSSKRVSPAEQQGKDRGGCSLDRANAGLP